MAILDDSTYPNGMLTDKFIKKGLDILFSNNADVDKAKYSTYEISLDVGYKLIEYDSAGNIQKKQLQNSDSSICAEPGDTILVYSKEEFSLPDNVYARVNTVGQIFIAGFSAENTYIDPGYHGSISITLINNSNRTLTMQAGAPLARVEFIKLSSIPEKSHPGQSRVRTSSVKPSFDPKIAEAFENTELDKLFAEIKSSITIDAIQKKSVRTDIALSRAYVAMLKELSEVKELLSSQDEKIKKHRYLAGFGLGTATVLWLDKFGFIEYIIHSANPSATTNSTFSFILTLLLNVLCSIFASFIYSLAISKFQNESH